MELHLTHFLLICPLVFLAGLIDAIGGGGGLISLPAYLIAGVPPHMAIATNKLSSSCGTFLATVRFIKNKLIDLTLAIPSIVCAIIGSYIGANLSLLTDERIMEYIMMILLPVVAVIVMNNKIFTNNTSEEFLTHTRKLYVIVALCGLIVGLYDGFYGPGTGTFLIIGFTIFAKMSVKQANGQAKIINLTSNITSLTVYLFSGQVIILLGIAGAISNMIGAYIGSGLVMKEGSKIVRPIILIVLVLLFLKVVGIY